MHQSLRIVGSRVGAAPASAPNRRRIRASGAAPLQSASTAAGAAARHRARRVESALRRRAPLSRWRRTGSGFSGVGGQVVELGNRQVDQLVRLRGPCLSTAPSHASGWRSSASKYDAGVVGGSARSRTARRLRPSMPGGTGTPTRSSTVGMRSTSRDGVRETAGCSAPFAQRIRAHAMSLRRRTVHACARRARRATRRDPTR